MRALVPILILLAAGISSAQDTGKTPPGSLTIEDVVRMAKAEVAEEIIIARVKTNAKAFDLNTDEIVELRKDGVSDTVVKYLIDPSQPYSPPAPPPPPAPVPAPAAVSTPAPAPPPPPPPKPKPPSDPLVLKLPPDPGIYYFTGPEQVAALSLNNVVPYKQPGKINTLSAGLVKGHVIGSVVGPTAGMHIASGPLIFYLRLPEKAMVDDFMLLLLDKAKDRRDLDFGTKPGKPVFPVSSVKQFENKEVDTRVYRLSVPMLKKGEYLFFILGSGDEKKGQLGKGYDFGVN